MPSKPFPEIEVLVAAASFLAFQLVTTGVVETESVFLGEGEEVHFLMTPASILGERRVFIVQMGVTGAVVTEMGTMDPVVSMTLKPCSAILERKRQPKRAG